MNQNLLDKEDSPYLRQHADNPVHWMTWNSESLQLARESGKPILLSIGYSACHWCHVMAHESFEHQQTADIMNQHFINIKVDKEERPDLDKIYQNAHTLLTQRPGGWPLTVFLTPDTHMPIFAGTYFPKQAKHGLPAFTSLLLQINEIWLSRKSDIGQQSTALQATYQNIYETSKPEATMLNNSVIDIARNQIEKQFDAINGGFSDIPKFPHPSIIEFSIRHWLHTTNNRQTDKGILHCAMFTLEKMANGGVFDHLGGGFSRYSTDVLWMIPHFEKMLYDNGPLLALYSHAWKIQEQNNRADLLFLDAACETANWVIREMQSDNGGYYSAQDADSEGSEGKFFVWPKEEINALLEEISKHDDITPESIDLFKQRFGLNLDENFEDDYHLHGYISESTLSNHDANSRKKLHHQFKLIRQQLFLHRENRVHPDADTKILCAWNGLMIHGMSVAGRYFNQSQYTQSAQKSALYLKKHYWKDDQLFASVNYGKTKLNAYIDDYAFIIYGLLELLQNQWNNELYLWAQQLADKLLSDFEDTEYGGFYFTSHHHENLIQRLKVFSDDAIPSGNAIAALALNRLGYLSGRTPYIEAAERCLKSAWNSINSAPISHCGMLNALREYLNPPDILIIRSQIDNKLPDSVNEKDWILTTQQFYLPTTLIYNIPANQPLHGSLADKSARNNGNIAYPCQGLRCQKPLESHAELENYLRNNSYRVLE